MRWIDALSLGLWALFVVALASCGTLGRGRTVAATQEVPRGLPSTQALDVGEIAFVRGGADPPFVLIRLQRGVKVPSGARLQATSSEDQSIILLKALAQKQSGYQVANVLSGRPRSGDPVVMHYGVATDDAAAEASLDDIPPLLQPKAGEEKVAAREPTPKLKPKMLPVEKRVTPAPAPELPPVPVLGAPAVRDDVDPRAPTREAEPLALPDWGPPDEGESFAEEIPPSSL